MAENYDQRKKDELMFHAASIFHEAMKKTRSDKSDAGAIFTICLAMCLENVDDEEDLREVLRMVARNCLAIWTDYRNLRLKYGLEN